MKLSIIIPYYNTLELTKQLLDTLIPQLTKEVEILIIEDFEEIELNRYARFNVRIFINNANSKGAAIPRNIGIDNSKGSFICFIDSDDMVTSDYISKIIDKINTSTFDYCYISWKYTTGKEVIIEDERPDWNWCVWNTIYTRELIGSQRFNPNELYEDVDFNTRVRKGKRENITDILYIYYGDRTDSLTDRIIKGIRTKDNLI